MKAADVVVFHPAQRRHTSQSTSNFSEAWAVVKMQKHYIGAREKNEEKIFTLIASKQHVSSTKRDLMR
jgi:hypothetical protein